MTTDTLAPDVLRPVDAARFCGISRRTLYALSETDPTFPRPIKFSARCVGWRRESLRDWLRRKEAQL